MGKRVFSPLPQTIREKPGQKFKIMWRISALISDPKREKEMMKGWGVKGLLVNLTRPMAEVMLEKSQKVKGADQFEYAIVPMDQEIPNA